MATILSTAYLAAQRSLASPSLTLFRFLGTLVAVTLACSVAIYSQTMGDVMLQATLSGGDHLINVTNTAPTGQALTLSGYAELDGYLRQRAGSDLQLPVRGVQTHHHSLPMPVYPWGEEVGFSTQPLGSADFEFYDDFARHVRVVAGTFPATGQSSSGAIQVVVSTASAARLNVRVGESVQLLPENVTVTPVRLVIAGLYAAVNPKDPFWDVSPALFATDAFIVPDIGSYLTLARVYQGVHSEFNWLLRVDTAGLRLQDIDRQLAAIRRFRSAIMSLVPGTSVLMSLDATLATFRDSYALLGLVLYALTLPVIGLILYYIMVATGLVMERQGAEIVLLRSRGASTLQVVRIYLVESLLYAAVSIGVGPFLALPVARAIGATSGFLSFNPGGAFPVAAQGQTFLVGAMAAALAVVAGLASAFRAVRRTMAGFKQEQARARRASLWQRFYLDVVLLLVSLYSYWVVARQGPLVTGDQQAAIAQDPLIVLAPTVFVIAGTLVAARLLPPLTAALAALANRSVPALLLALRGISRMPQQYMRLMTLLSLTLAVGVFVAAIAGTIERSTVDGAAFRAGAALRLIEYDTAIHDFDALPAAWHERLPGVLAASPALRLERYQAGLVAPAGNDQETILGIDPATLGRVIWFRSEFADQPLHDLLQTLAATPNGVIASDTFLGATGLHVGDTVEVSVQGGHFRGTIVGTVRYFPTLDPPNGEFGLVNLATLLRQAHGAVSGPSEMWLRLNGGATTAQAVIKAVQATGREVISYRATGPHGLTLLANPLQVGLYGVVSIGFVIAAGLSMLSFFVYAYLSVQRRSAEFAVLRALGLTPAQAGGILIAEQVLLMVLGTGAALVIGLLASRLFVPYLPLTDSPVPPLSLAIPWAAVWELAGIVALALLPTLASLTWLMGHLQVSRVLRMGEA